MLPKRNIIGHNKWASKDIAITKAKVEKDPKMEKIKIKKRKKRKKRDKKKNKAFC